MKKIIAATFCVLLTLSCFAGCKDKSNDNNNNSSSEPYMSSDSSTYKGFTGTVNKKWDDVKDDYKKLEDEAETEVDSTTTYTKDEVQKLVTSIENGTEELKNGVTDDNEETARRVYKDAHKLERLAKKGNSEASKEFDTLGKNAKALVKQYYGVADADFETVTDAVADGIKRVGKFTDDVWNSFLDMFK